MKYTVDEIINDVVTIINTQTEEKKYVNISNMPDNVKENDILVFDGTVYHKDLESQKQIEDRIKNKMDMLRG